MINGLQLRRKDILAPLSLLLAICVVFGSVAYQVISLKVNSDYLFHHMVAEKIMNQGVLTFPHFLYEILIIGIDKLGNLGQLDLPALIITTLSNCLTGIILFFGYFRSIGSAQHRPAYFRRIVLVLVVMLAAPIPVFYFYDKHFYLGYFGLTSYHNPTVTLLKPFAALQLLYVAKALKSPTVASSRISQALLTVLSVLAKPSFLMCLIPATLAMGMSASAKKRQIASAFLLLGVILPGSVALLWQFFFRFGSGTDHIVFAPLRVYALYSAIWMLIPKLVLTIAFPISVSICFREKSREDTLLKLAWTCYLVALGYAVLFAEATKPWHGNFFWGAEITGFLLFAVSARLFLSEFEMIRSAQSERVASSHLRNIRIMLPSALLLLHLASGAFMYYLVFNGRNFW